MSSSGGSGARKVFLLAGEASGDLQGALLAAALRAARPDLEIIGVGGGCMAEAGVRLLLRSEELAVVGILEVVGHAGRVLRALEAVRNALAEERPDLFVPIDFPDFNFRLLPVASRLGIPIVYYISPQVWAWRPARAEVLRRYVRTMVVIFPFEEAFFRERGVPVRWVGHPLVDRIEPAGEPETERRSLGLPPEGPAVALLPGSRRSELGRMGPLLREVRRRIDETRGAAGRAPVRWLLGRAAGLPDEAWRLLEDAGPPLSGVEALRAADLGVVASGTVTLEAALLGRPVVVVYRMNPLTYALARRLVRVEHVAMANLVAGGRIVPEHVQDAATPEAVAGTVEDLLEDAAARLEIRRALLQARERLGPPGAAARAAGVLLEVLGEGRDEGREEKGARSGSPFP